MKASLYGLNRMQSTGVVCWIVQALAIVAKISLGPFSLTTAAAGSGFLSILLTAVSFLAYFSISIVGIILFVYGTKQRLAGEDENHEIEKYVDRDH